MFNDFEAVMYENTAGKFEVHIKLKDVSNYEWNFGKLRKKYPTQIDILRTYGFTNKSRDLYAKAAGIKHAIKKKEHAEHILRLYKLVLGQN